MENQAKALHGLYELLVLFCPLLILAVGADSEFVKDLRFAQSVPNLNLNAKNIEDCKNNNSYTCCDVLFKTLTVSLGQGPGEHRFNEFRLQRCRFSFRQRHLETICRLYRYAFLPSTLNL